MTSTTQIIGSDSHGLAYESGVSPDRSRTARRGRRRVSKRDVAGVTSQLAIMTRSGLNLADALHTLARRTRQARLREIMHLVHQEVLAGRTFSAALSDYSHVFGETYIASVAAGEASGRMAEVLGQLAQLQHRELRLRSTIRTLLAYPVVLSSVSVAVILGLVLFVLPQFAEIFSRYDMPLPALTSLLLAVAGEARARYWIWLPAALAPVAALVAMHWSEPGRRLRDRLLLHTAVVRDVSRVLIMGRLCRLLGLMLQSGVPLVESLRLAQSATTNTLFRGMFADLEDSVVGGGGLGECLARCDFLPDMAADMLTTAEQSGNLGGVAQLVGEHFEEEGEAKLRELVTVLEPAITVSMGIVVAVVVLAVMLPMFDLTSVAQQGR